MIVSLEDFRGGIPLSAPKRLAASAAYKAEHCDLSDGSLRTGKFVDDGTAGHPVIQTYYSAPLTIFPISKSKFLEWSTVTHAVTSPILNNTNRRTIYVEPGAAPKQTDASIATSGAQPYPSAWYYLGIPIPKQTPTVTVLGGSGATETRAYIYTLVSIWDEEGPPSPAGSVTGFVNGAWRVAGWDTTNPGSGYNIVKKRLYRVVTGTATATYLFVGEFDLSLSQHDDYFAATSLGEAIKSADWFAPPSGLKQIVVTPSGVCVGHDGISIYASEPNIPHAWPFTLPVDAPIAGIAVFGERIFVATYGRPYIISGQVPDQFILTQIPSAGSNRQAIPPVTSGGGVYYYSSEGLLSIGDGGTDNLSDRYFHTSQRYQHVNKAFFMSKSYLIHEATTLITSTNTSKSERSAAPLMLGGSAMGDGVVQMPLWTAVSAFCDDPKQLNPGTEDIFAASGGYVRAILNSVQGRYFGAQPPYQWWSKHFMIDKPVAMTALKVEADLRDLSPLMRARDERIVENALTTQKFLGSKPLASGELAVSAGSINDDEINGLSINDDDWLYVHSTPYTGFYGSNGEAVNATSLTPNEIDPPTISGNAGSINDFDINDIEINGDDFTLVASTGVTADAPKFREPYLRVKVIGNPDHLRGSTYLEDGESKNTEVVLFDDYVSNDRVYRFPLAGKNITADCYQIRVEGLIPVHRVTICTTPEELETV